MEASLIAFLASILLGALVVFTRGYHQRFTLDTLSASARKIHTAPAPRIGGLGEDFTRKVSSTARLCFTFIAAAIACFVLDASITELDLPGSAWLLSFAIPSLLFTMFAVGGLAHGINIVDGLNGLAGFTALMVLGAIAWVATQVGDQPIRRNRPRPR